MYCTVVRILIQKRNVVPKLHVRMRVQSFHRIREVYRARGTVRQPKSRERGGSNEEEKETEPGPLKQRSKERPDWQDGAPVTGPGEQLRPKNRGKRVYKAGVIG